MGGDDKTSTAQLNNGAVWFGGIGSIKHRRDFAHRNTGGECTAYSRAGPKILAVGKYTN